ncbi:MAG: hypothetical protein Q8P22_10360 [Chloroflexota bacterium]|nr:hypothetical protein [Chloroflexota bacterium]
MRAYRKGTWNLEVTLPLSTISYTDPIYSPAYPSPLPITVADGHIYVSNDVWTSLSSESGVVEVLDSRDFTAPPVTLPRDPALLLEPFGRLAADADQVYMLNRSLRGQSGHPLAGAMGVWVWDRRTNASKGFLQFERPEPGTPGFTIGFSAYCGTALTDAFWSMPGALFAFFPEGKLWRYDKASGKAARLSWEGAQARFIVPGGDRLYLTLAPTTGDPMVCEQRREVLVLAPDGTPLTSDPWHRRELPATALIVGADAKRLYVFTAGDSNLRERQDEVWGSLLVYDRADPTRPPGRLVLEKDSTWLPSGASGVAWPFTPPDILVDWPYVYISLPGPSYQEAPVTIRVQTGWEQFWHEVGEDVRDIWLEAFQEWQVLIKKPGASKTDFEQLAAKYADRLLPRLIVGFDPKQLSISTYFYDLLRSPTWSRYADGTGFVRLDSAGRPLYMQAERDARARYCEDDRTCKVHAEAIVTASREYADYKVSRTEFLPARVVIVQVDEGSPK